MLVYQTINSFTALRKLVELKLEVKKIRSLKNYAFDAYKNVLKKINFPNYEQFVDVNPAYSDFFQNLMTVIGNVDRCQIRRIKENNQIGLMKKYFKNLGQGKNSINYSRKQRCISIKNYIKRLNTTH